ncbi:hypothetical protein ACX0G9_27590 [Flavitalea flava]
MRYLKYLVYAASAIAIPLWIALGDFAKKTDSKTTFAVDSATRSWLDTILPVLIKTLPNPRVLPISSKTDSLLAELVKAEQGEKAVTQEYFAAVTRTLKKLQEIADSSNRGKASSGERPQPVEIKIDPISVNVHPPDRPDHRQEGNNDQYPNPTPNPSDSTDPFQNVYYLSEAVQSFELWHVKVPLLKAGGQKSGSASAEQDIGRRDSIYLVLNDASLNYEIILDSLGTIDVQSEPVVHFPLNLTVAPRNTVILRVWTHAMHGRFYIYGRLRSTRVFLKANIPFRIPVYIPQ